MNTPTKEVQHTCKKCGNTFKEYLYHEDCKSCNDGDDHETGERCMGCGGKGDHTSLIKDQCPPCWEEYVEDNW